MSLISPVFMFVCLPLTLALYAFIPQSAKKHTLAIFCVIFYLVANIGNPFSLILMVLTVVAVYFLSRLIDRQRGKNRSTVTVSAVAVLALVLLTLRFADPLGVNILHIKYPFGASVWILSAISCIVDVKRGDAPPPSAVDAVVYISYFPVMAAGPFIKYKDSLGLFDKNEVTFEGISKGAGYFMLGFIKRFAVAAVLGEMLGAVWADPASGAGILSVIEYILIVPVAVYAFFSGYSDMGTGVSIMYGVKLPDNNFDRPLTAVSVLDYVRRFMSTVYGFAQDYIGHAICAHSSSKTVSSLSYFASFEFLLFWFSADTRAAVILSPLALLTALIAANTKERVRSLLVRAASGVFVFFITALVWGVLLISDIDTLPHLLSNLVLDISNPTGGVLFGGFSMVRYAVTFLITFITLAVLDRSVHAPGEYELTKGKAVLTTVINCIMLLMFAFSLLFYYPQFPISGLI